MQREFLPESGSIVLAHFSGSCIVQALETAILERKSQFTRNP